jgi:ubiquinone/menaquinone biosynthesis C-methylase UbiE
MNRDFIRLVENGYDEIANAYTAWREEEPLLFRDELQDLCNRLPQNANVLDVGCGAGVPVTLFLSERFNVTGIDISEKQIELARQRVPGAKFFKQDMLRLDVAPPLFDAVTCFYSLIHVPREKHALALANMNRALKIGGYLLLITGNSNLLDDVDTFFGKEMYWSHFDRETSLQMIRDAGLQIIWDKVVSDRPSGSHVLVLAQKTR